MGAQLAFVNAVAELVEENYKQAKVGTLAYVCTRKPPATIKPRHNVQIQLCSIECCTLHAIDDPACECNRAFCQDLAGWQSICDGHLDLELQHRLSPLRPAVSEPAQHRPERTLFTRITAQGVFMEGNYNALRRRAVGPA